MMKPEVVKLEGQLREPGRRSSGQLRKEKRVPSVLYGPAVKENLHFHIGEQELEKIMAKSQTKLQELVVDGKTYNTLLKKVEFDPISDRPIHADFYVLEKNRRVSLRIPIRITGTAVGVTDGGGRLFQPMRIVRVRVLPEKIPAQFDLDVSHLNIGDSLHVAELDMEGITPLDEPSRTIVTVTPPKSEALFTTAVEEDEEIEAEEGELAEGETPEDGAEEEGEETKE